MSLVNLSLREVSNIFQKREAAAMEILDEYLKSALKGSCITFCNEASFKGAKALDNNLNGNLSLISALPFSLKDNICTKNILTTCNSKSLKNYIPSFNSDIAARLISCRAILTAKSCMREFSVGKIEDSAFELRNYLVWAGTNADANIGAFSIGTDLGVSESFFGMWIIKPSGISTRGIITGAPSLEKPTLMARRADDLVFLLPFLYGKHKNFESQPIDPCDYKVIVYNDLNASGYLFDFMENSGFKCNSFDFPFLGEADLIFEVVLCTEFYENLLRIGMPSNEATRRFNEEYSKNRTEGIGYEARLNILKGAHLLSEKNREKTFSILDSKKHLEKRLLEYLDTYDFIASPVIYEDRLSKASALLGLAELTVPFADALPFKLITKNDKQHLLLDAALYLEKLL